MSGRSSFDLRVGDALGVVGEGGTFDLIFADAQGGKWAGLDRTIAALRPHGLLVVRRYERHPGLDGLITAPGLSSLPATPEPAPTDPAHRSRRPVMTQAARSDLTGIAAQPPGDQLARAAWPG